MRDGAAPSFSMHEMLSFLKLSHHTDTPIIGGKKPMKECKFSF